MGDIDISACQGVITLVDDMLEFGKNRAEHDKALINVTEIARQLEIKLNDDKLQVAVPRVKYFGYILTPDGT